MAITRQLAAIMFADIQGYTALMQENEMRARTMRDKFHDVLEKECKTHQGRVVEWSGDGALCIFNSSIEAVRAAISIQQQMMTDPKVPLRIGIHSGDVLFDGDNIYGNPVNVASRVESFAVAGGIFISGIVFDEIQNQKDIEAISFGKYDLKNVKEPVEIYAISNPGLKVPGNKILQGKGIQTGGKKNLLFKVLFSVAAIIFLFVLASMIRDQIRNSRKPAAGKLKIIAVLPFTNLSASKEDEYFADGICDEILTQLSKTSSFNVISRTSTLQFKNTKETIKKIGEKIGADVLLEGSVQKSNDHVRIHVQLINSNNDEHLWAETYDREMKDVFAIQTDIAKRIAVALNTTLTEKDVSLFDVVPTDDLEAYNFYLKGNKYAASFWDYGRIDEVDDAARMYEQAIRLDPEFTAAYSAIIELYAGIAWNKPFLNTDDYRVKSKQWLDKMIGLNIDDAHTHNAIAIYRYKGERDYKSALSELNMVDKILGNGKSTYMLRADILRRMGRVDEAIDYLKKEADLFPRVAKLWGELAETYKLKRNFDSSLYYINKAIAIGPDLPGLYSDKSMYYAELKGDINTAYSILKNAHSLVDTNEFKSDFGYFEILKGNYDRAIQRAKQNTDSLGILWQYKIVPGDFVIALIYLVEGRHDQAKIYFQQTHNLIAPLAKQYPDDFRLHAALGVALAGLGKKEEALSEGIKARDLMPVSKDAILGISPLESLALIHTVLGEKDAAIDILEQLLKMPFAWTMSNTIPLYKMHYYWKPLQGDPRFQKMLGK